MRTKILIFAAALFIVLAIVFGALAVAKNKYKANEAVKTWMSSARAQGEMYYTLNHVSYAGNCVTPGAAKKHGVLTFLLSSGQKNVISNVTISPATSSVSTSSYNAVAGAWNQVTCHDSPQAWAAEAPLQGSTAAAPDMWCVDSNGSAKMESTNLAANATACK